MWRLVVAASAFLAAGAAFCAPSGAWIVSVDPADEIGAIKPMNAVNGGPAKFKSNSRAWRHARIPFGRTHDMNHSWEFGGPHTIDVDAIFPNPDADENDPGNYDFTYTDMALDLMRECGTEPFYRLGPSIESGAKKYHTHPPRDFAKWARVCEHIILHCNEGWANGRRYGIRYWEIWFEPDLGPSAWTGTREQFLELFKTAAIHLKGRFPKLKIGGPGFANALAWKDSFLPFCRRENVPLDFYSWHAYKTDAHVVGKIARDVRALLDTNGFERTESILGEWNYVRTFKAGGEWEYSRQVESGRFIQKGAAFAAAMMSECQGAPVDVAMYYDVRTYGGMNMLFDPISCREMKGYYPFRAWGRLLHDYGTQVRATADERVSEGASGGQLFVTAAKGKDGRLAVWLARYSNDDNVQDWRTVKIRLPEDCSGRRATCHVTDDIRTYTETTLDVDKDGMLELLLVPNGFALVEVAARGK